MHKWKRDIIFDMLPNTYYSKSTIYLFIIKQSAKLEHFEIDKLEMFEWHFLFRHLHILPKWNVGINQTETSWYVFF